MHLLVYCVATLKPNRPIHLEIQTHRSKAVGILRSSFREDGKIKHSNHGRITGLSLDQLKLIQAAFRGEVIPKDSAEAFRTLHSKEYGASYASKVSCRQNNRLLVNRLGKMEAG